MGSQSRSVVWTQAALRELEDALTWLAAKSPDAADELFDAAMTVAASLSTLSERGRLVPELEDGRTRELFVESYRLLYEVAPDRVAIVAFLHSARDFEAWWRAR